MPEMEIPDAAVEAGAREMFFEDDRGGHVRGPWTFDTIPPDGRENYRRGIRAALNAALPHLRKAILEQAEKDFRAAMDEAEPFSVELDDLEAAARLVAAYRAKD